MTERIRLGGFQVNEEAIDAVVATLRSGWPGPGPEVAAFEEEFAAQLDRSPGVAVNSGTAALHLAVRLLDLAPGTEVITTPITFVSTNQVLLYEDLVPVFADVDPSTGLLDLDSVASKVGPNTGALMVLHYGGQPMDIDALEGFTASTGLPVVHDCAHGTGARFRDEPLGARPALHAFSFQATKNLPLVDGGMLLTRSPEEAERARRLRWMGIDQGTHERSGRGGYRWRYHIDEVGFRYAMSDLNAAIGRALLPSLEAGNERRREIARRYDDGLAGTCTTPLRRLPGRTGAMHLYVARCEERDRLQAHLDGAGIDTGVHYLRNDRYPLFEAAELPGAARFEAEAISLPMHLGLSDADVDRVITAIRAFDLGGAGSVLGEEQAAG